MTISSSVRKAGPFTGDGVTADFTFAYKVFSDSDLYVVKLRTSTNVETVLTLTTDYTVALNADQDGSPGGVVTLTVPLASGYTLTLGSDLDYLQPTDLTNQGGFYPSVITDSLDRLTIQTQQLQEQLDRCPKLPISSTDDADTLSEAVLLVADDLTNVDAVADAIADVIAVSVDMADVSAVASNVASVSNFAAIYYGPSATNPATRKDGSALQYGDMYFNTSAVLMYVFGSSGWLPAQTPSPITVTTQRFNGTGAQTAFTLSSMPPFLNSLEVYISGVAQVPGADYTLNGTTVTFATAPLAGTNNIFCRWSAATSAGVPNDGSVTTAKIVDYNVTAAKLAKEGTAGQVLISGGASAGPSWGSKYSTGNVVQIVEATPYTTYTSTTSVIPIDDSIPQITEGTEYVTVTITPTSASNRLVIFAWATMLYSNNTVDCATALFRDSTTNALAVNYSHATYGVSSALRHEMAAGTTAATTFRLRIGTCIGSSPLYINGNNSNRMFGGVAAIRLQVMEVKA